MIKETNFPNAFKEVHIILQNMEENDVSAIPQELKKIIDENMNIDYEFLYDPNIEFKNQIIMRETRVIFSYIFLNFWATEQQKKLIKAQFEHDIEIENEAKIEKYNLKDLFKKQSIIRDEKITKDKLASIVVIEEKNSIKAFFKKIKKLITNLIKEKNKKWKNVK